MPAKAQNNPRNAAREGPSPRRLEYRRPWLYPAQREAIFHEARYVFIEAATKTGKTVGCLMWLFEQALRAPVGGNVWWVAPWYRTARIAYRRLRFSLRKYAGFIRSNDSAMTLTIGGAHQVTMEFLSAEQPDTLYGEDVYAVVLDEASRMRPEAFYAVRSTLTATRGPCRVIGNVKGRNTWFYQLSRKAEAQQMPNGAYRRLTWSHAVDAGLVPQSEIDDARSMLPPHVFQELYDAIPSDDAGNPFSFALGALSDGDPVVWGWDLAKSVNWTVGIALDDQGDICRLERFRRPWTETVSRIRQIVGETPALIDSTGVGDPVLELLQHSRESYSPNFEGYKFSESSKQRLMEQLSARLAQGLRIPDGPLAAELSVFEYQYSRRGVRYSAPDGFDDDCVMALALAVWHWSQSHSGLFGSQPMIRCLA